MIRSRPSMGRAGAVAETLLAFCLVHLCFRSIKKFTEWGWWEAEHGVNFSPGVVMILATLVLIVLPRRSLETYGLCASQPIRDLNFALLFFAMTLGVGLLATLGGVHHAPRELGIGAGVVFMILGLAGLIGFLWLLERRPMLPDRVPAAATITVLLAVVLAPMVAAAVTRQQVGPVVLAVSWRLFCAGVGEELFFRGYIQSRLNEAWGRPWRLLGVPFGMGLVVSSALFGAVHVLNPFDYFSGSGHFAWGHGLATLAMPYGFLREKTGSVVAPAALHGLLDVVVLLPSILAPR